MEDGEAPPEKKESEEVVTVVEEEEDATIDFDMDGLDVYAVDDVMDIGNGAPLMADFEYEDWALLSLRFELHLLVQAFKHDLADPERTAFHESHTPFYYNKYFKKPFNVKNYGVESLANLLPYLEDSLEIEQKRSTLESLLEEDTPMDCFVRLAEGDRKERQRLIDAGVATEPLKFPKPGSSAPMNRGYGKGDQQPYGGYGGKSQGKQYQSHGSNSYGDAKGSYNQGKYGGHGKDGGKDGHKGGKYGGGFQGGDKGGSGYGYGGGGKGGDSYGQGKGGDSYGQGKGGGYGKGYGDSRGDSYGGQKGQKRQYEDTSYPAAKRPAGGCVPLPPPPAPPPPAR